MLRQVVVCIDQPKQYPPDIYLATYSFWSNA